MRNRIQSFALSIRGILHPYVPFFSNSIALCAHAQSFPLFLPWRDHAAHKNAPHEIGP